MGWRTKLVRLQSGERFPLLVPANGNGSPHSEVLTYTLSQLRPASAVRTMTIKLDAIGRGLCFCADRAITLAQRAASAEFLSDDELSAWATVTRSRADGHGTVETAVASAAYQAFVDFSKWTFAPIIARLMDDARRIAATDQFKDFQRRASANRPQSQGPVETGIRVDETNGLTSRQRLIFLSAITPGDATNPYRACDQHRMYAPLLTAYALGPRSGELLGLMVKDFKQNTNPATLTIHRRHDNPEDPRTTQPVAKTHGRILALDDQVRDALHTWIVHHRSDRARYPLARTHGYIFTNYKGAPLGLSGYQKRVRFLRDHVTGLDELVNHLLRHDANERFVEAALANGRKPSEIAEYQCDLNGWSIVSKMPQRYARGALRKRANQESLATQKAAMDGRY